MNRPFSLLALLLCTGLLVACQAATAADQPESRPDAPATATIDNPYHDVDWAATERHKANFHTHTRLSDGQAQPDEVIDLYHDLGYTVLALTDHDTKGPVETTWPWSAFDRDPSELGMVAIQGNEISKLHHTGSYFSDYGDPDVESEEQIMLDILAHEGTAVFFHPGRYDKPIAWYVDMYTRHDHLVGFEVFNQTDRYPGDRAKWDAVLTELMPDRPVWAFSNDDMHKPEAHLGYSWNVMLVSELNEPAIRDAMETGRFYFVHRPRGIHGADAPTIQAITVDADAATITIDAAGHESITWVSQGEVIHEGAVLNLQEHPEADGYVRAEVHGPAGTVAGTQPFGLRRPASEED